jgi:hypothetical protein
MASKIVGSIVATHIATGLKTVLHVHKDGGSVTFKKPDIPDWSHTCHSSNEKDAKGWCHEVNTIATPTFKDAQYFPL